MSTKYTYKYFDLRARGELSRYMFALKGVNYDETLIQLADWAKEKDNTQFGWLPNLTFNGRTFSDSMAIATFLAREFGYGGKTNVERLEIDQILGIVKDAIPVLGGMFFEKDETKKAELKKTAYEETFPKYFKAFDKVLSNNRSGYFAGNSLTIADVAVFDFCDHLDASFVAKHPRVKANVAKVAANDRIKAYKANRKATPF